MTLTEALQYLETTSRVSCPQITCEQAREIAEVLRGHQSIIDLVVMLEDGVKHGAGCCDEIGRGRRLTQIREHIEHVLSGRQAEQVKNQLDDAWRERDESRLLADREFTLRQRAEKERDKALVERDEARAKLREVERERWAEIDCGQPDICAKAPGCQKHWALRASELAKERDEARAKLREMEGERNAWFSVYEEAADDRERYAQAACGFAWDAGREMAALMAEVTKAERDALRAEMEALRLMPVEAAPDFDADDYAKPGKR